MLKQHASAVQNAIVATGAVLASAVLFTAILTPPASAQVRGAGAGQGTIPVQPGYAGFAGSGGRPGLDLEREDLVAVLQVARVTSIGDVHLVDLVSSSHILTTILTSPMTPKNLVGPQYLSSRQPLPSHLHRLRPDRPLLIEWQGDHFERMTLSEKKSGAEPASLTPLRRLGKFVNCCGIDRLASSPAKSCAAFGKTGSYIRQSRSRTSTGRARFPRWPHRGIEQLHHHEWNHLFEG